MRFSLKTLLAAVTVASVLCCIFFAIPSVVAIFVLGFLWFLSPPALIAGIVYGRGYGRAFSIGCIATGGCLPIYWMYSYMAIAEMLAGFSNMGMSVDDETALYSKLFFGASFILIGISGLIGMSVRWLSLRMAAPQPVAAPSQPILPPEYSVLQRRVTTFPTDLASVKHDDADLSSKES